MTEIFDLLTPGRLIIRRPDGRVYLDSRDRTMVRLNQRTYSNIRVSFPKFSSERRSSIRQTSSGLRQDWSIGKQTSSATITLGAIGTATPNWLMVNVSGFDADAGKTTVAYGIFRNYAFPQRQWLPLNGGSLHVEDIRTNDADVAPLVQRILTVRPSGSNFVVTTKQASRAFAKNDNPLGGFDTAARYTFSFALTWGVFDL